jgi:hypothetical protein
MLSNKASLATLKINLRLYQKRLNIGDNLPSLSRVADIAGIHRDTLYALLAGERVSERSQYAISKALQILNETDSKQPSRLISIEIGREGPKLRFGLTKFNMFK